MTTSVLELLRHKNGCNLKQFCESSLFCKIQRSVNVLQTRWENRLRSTSVEKVRYLQRKIFNVEAAEN